MAAQLWPGSACYESLGLGMHFRPPRMGMSFPGWIGPSRTPCRKCWTLNWGTPTAGEHAITSRAIDANGEIQPDPDDPLLAGKTTFWESNGQITRRVSIP